MPFSSKESLKKKLHSQRESHIQDALNSFGNNHAYDTDLPIKLKELRNRLEAEATRIYPMVDESILNERFKRAKKTALITGAGVLLAGLFLGTIATFGAFLMPIISALIAAYASISTIKTSYNARVKGAMASVVEVYENDLKKGMVKLKSKEESKSKQINLEEGKENFWVKRVTRQPNETGIAFAH